MDVDDAPRSVVNSLATATLFATVAASITPCGVVLISAPAATAGARLNRFSKMAVTKAAVLPPPYRLVDSWLVPKLSIKAFTAGLAA